MIPGLNRVFSLVYISVGVLCSFLNCAYISISKNLFPNLPTRVGATMLKIEKTKRGSGRGGYYE